MIKIESEDVLKDILKNPRFEIEMEGWHMGADYKADWTVEDDDDGDGFRDEDIFSSDPYFPYEEGDTHFNEPPAGVVYRKYPPH